MPNNEEQIMQLTVAISKLEQEKQAALESLVGGS